MNKEKGTPTVTFEKHIQSPKQPNRKFVLKPLTEDYILPAARLASYSYCKENPLLYGVLEEIYYNSVGLPLAKYAALEQVGVVCIEVSTGELVGVHLCEDYPSMEVNPAYVQHPLMDERLSIYDVAIKDTEHMWKQIPREKFETVWIFDVALRPDVQDLGLFAEIAKFMAFEHPILKKSKVLAIDAFHPGSHRDLEAMDFRTIWHKKWTEFKNIAGYEGFAKLPSYNTSGFKDNDEFGYAVLMIDRTNTILQGKNVKPKLCTMRVCRTKEKAFFSWESWTSKKTYNVIYLIIILSYIEFIMAKTSL